MKSFTEKELAQYDGKNGRPVYVGYRGKVYDVSSSFLWRDGNHQVLHSGGVDLTAAVEQAPHSGDVLEKFPVVGILDSAHTSKKSPEP
jgi:predicted heme/steroid binding protein